ncbi:MAG: membrane protein insertion efficiency factor YidD [Spirochaetota bacterium]
MARDQDQADHTSPFHRVRHVVRVVMTIPVWLYQRVISPAIPPHCIYTPTCSEYTRHAILAHGFAGALAGLFRLFRCVGGLYTGGEDPVPERITWSYLVGSYRRFWRGRTQRSDE